MYAGRWAFDVDAPEHHHHQLIAGAFVDDLDGLRAGARLGGLAQQALESRRGRSIVVVVFEFNDGEVEVRGQVGQGRREAMLRLDDGGEGGISG